MGRDGARSHLAVVLRTQRLPHLHDALLHCRGYLAGNSLRPMRLAMQDRLIIRICLCNPFAPLVRPRRRIAQRFRQFAVRGVGVVLQQFSQLSTSHAPFGFHVSRSSPSSLRCGPTLAQLCDDELSEHPALTNCENNTTPAPGVASPLRLSIHPITSTPLNGAPGCAARTVAGMARVTMLPPATSPAWASPF